MVFFYVIKKKKLFNVYNLRHTILIHENLYKFKLKFIKILSYLQF